jgi:hypothetical protein
LVGKSEKYSFSMRCDEQQRRLMALSQRK